MKKILLVFGTRPEAIKMAPVIKEIERAPGLQGIVCVTAQHRRMLDQALEVFGIRPHIDLCIMGRDQDLFDITARCLGGLKGVFTTVRPDMVLVQGDTTTALAAGLAAYYLKIPLGHIESGLRTHNRYSPFPEEKNRHILGALAECHFAPTQWARANLVREGVDPGRIWVTGNTVIDALRDVSSRVGAGPASAYWTDYFKTRWKLDLASEDRKVILVTGHRRESFGEGLLNICQALKDLSRRPDTLIIYPVHLNPNVRKAVHGVLDGIPDVRLLEPLEYEPFVFLMTRSFLVLTDSGGIQEEAPSLGKPVLVMRETTERPEGVEAGVARLVGTKREAIVSGTAELLDNPEAYESMARVANPYGDGTAARRIVDIVSGMPFSPGL